MPRLDKTGPEGKGSGTGRGLGDCLTRRRVAGRGRGLRRFFSWTLPKDKNERTESLREYEKKLEEELEDVKKEL